MQRMTAYQGGPITADKVSRGDTVDERWERKLQAARRRWLKCLLISSVTAAVTGIFGLALSAASLLRLISAANVLSGIGLGLLVAAFFALILVAHCLDRVDDANSETKVAVYRKKLFGRETE
jgi:hypothetical protein